MPHTGVDLGGTRLASAVFADDGTILHCESVPLAGAATSLDGDAGLYGAGRLALLAGGR